MVKNVFLILICNIFIFHNTIFSQGHVYLVIGSDTAIWDGMNTSEYNCTYDPALFIDQQMNTYKVMDPSFRSQLKDSYGQSMKMTWWMMAGNIFRYATNMNIPLANTMTLHLMKKYHNKSIQILGDELTLHYHTFAWSDYDNDGKYWWNQAKNFSECLDDFNVTLAHFLLEENVFPVSFRSGWHYMGNEWQNYLDGLIPYSLHNDYPNVRIDNDEPTDNNYDWSKASKEFVPYHPSLSDYQLAGQGKSWNTRSRYMGSVSQTMMDEIFAKAAKGTDQVPCFWAHLPEADFPENMKRIGSLAHISAGKYPAVKFKYCTAVEAMQLWRKGLDTIPPAVNIEEIISGTDVKFKIYSNEDIFQTKPFIAVKNIYEEYSVLDCQKLNDYCWITKEALPRYLLAKVGAALTDKMGNLTTKFFSYLPDDIYIDNLDEGYLEKKGNWTNSTKNSWGTDSRQCSLTSTDTAVVEWKTDLKESGLFNIWIQIPEVNNAADHIYFTLLSGNSVKNLPEYQTAFSPGKWNYIATVTLQPGDIIQMTAYGDEQSGKILTADVLKLSALVKQKSISVTGLQFQSNSVSEKDTILLLMQIRNEGTQSLHINNIYSVNGYFSASADLPVEIPGMSSLLIPLIFYSDHSGQIQDSLTITSDDPRKPALYFPYNINVEKYFKIVDNEDSTKYKESGLWATSNSEAWGNSSRYSWSGNNGSAIFKVRINYPGRYEVSFIVPKTQNAVTNALYIIKQGLDTLTSVIRDQNVNSGSWVSLGTYMFNGIDPAEVIIKESGPVVQNKVLRADALKFQLLDLVSVDRSSELADRSFSLMQNFPNPFNPETKIIYYLESLSTVDLIIFNALGESVLSIHQDGQSAGEYTIYFNGSSFSSGVYFYSINVSSAEGRQFRDVKKMILLR